MKTKKKYLYKVSFIYRIENKPIEVRGYYSTISNAIKALMKYYFFEDKINLKYFFENYKGNEKDSVKRKLYTEAKQKIKWSLEAYHEVTFGGVCYKIDEIELNPVILDL